MHDCTVEVRASEGIACKLIIRPFLNRPSIAYELVLVRSSGDRIYDRRIAILSGTDARDMHNACPDISFQECQP